MNKWADFVIVAVRYDENNEYITSVMRLKDSGYKLTGVAIKSRAIITRAIDRGLTYVTAHKNPKAKKYRKGFIIRLHEDNYLKIESSQMQRDNLGILPTF